MTKPTSLVSDDEIQHLYNKSGLPLLFAHQKKDLINFAREIEAVILCRQQLLREHESLQNENYYRQLEAQCCDPNQ